MDVDSSRLIRQAEVGAMRQMVDRTEERFGIKPDWIAADTAYGSSDNLVWLALKRQILPFVPVFDNSKRKDGTWSRADFTRAKTTIDTSVQKAKNSVIPGAIILIPLEIRMA